jgi:hypothetical protein
MTLGSLWQLIARETRAWMVGGTVAVLAGVAIGLAPALGFPDGSFPFGVLTEGGLPGGEFPGHEPGLEILLPSLFLSLGGGYAVLFPGVRVSRCTLRVVRDWKLYPLSGRLLWILAHVTAVAGLAVCIIAGATSPAVSGLLVWLFTGTYLALAGWAAALMGTAANIRLIGSDEGLVAPAVQPS